MKKILVVDDRGLFPELAPPLAEWVECHATIRDRPSLDLAAYATIFVHDRNQVKQQAVEALDADKLDVIFIFSGDEDRVSEYAGVYTLPRSVYAEQFAAFVRCYLDDPDDPERCARVFRAASSPDDEIEGASLDRAASDSSEFIRFFAPTGKMPAGRERTAQEHDYPIALGDGRQIDYEETLAPLRALETPRPIVLEETYVDEGDGLDLLLHLRLDAEHPYSRFPVTVRLQRPLEAWLRQHPRFSILTTDGVVLVRSGDAPLPDPHALAGATLSVEAHRRILERLPLAPEDLTGRHDLANEWGPVQLRNGLSKLSPNTHPLPAWARDNLRRLMRRRYYKYLFALLTLRARDDAPPEAGPPLDEVIQQGQHKYRMWLDFLREADSPLRVLLVDDEIDRGWKEAFESIFADAPEAGCVETPFAPEEIKKQLDAVIKRTREGHWDVVLADLRLTEADQDASSRSVDHLSGMRLIRALKSARPEIPVIAVTASNKAWTAKALTAAGAEGYWVKENPAYGVNLAYTVENAADLIDAIRSSVARRRKVAFLWNFLTDLEACVEDASYVPGWSYPFKRQRSTVEDHLTAVTRRLKRAYWHLTAKHSRFEASTFEVNPTDLAFLTVWSCLNEIHALYFQHPSHGAFTHCDPGDTLRFRFRNPATGHAAVYWTVRGNQSDVADIVPEDQRPKLCPEKQGKPTYPPRHAEKIRIEWLLRLVDRQDLVDCFDEARRLRNGLALEHGDAQWARHASLVDIRDVVDVWRALLITPFAPPA